MTRSVAILTGPDTHLDHLGVLSHLLNIPLVVTDERTYALARQFYPQFKITLKEIGELSLEKMASEYDVIYQTGKFWAAELGPAFEMLFNKTMRFVFCPHGNSDKGHSLSTHAPQDISLVYGDHQMDLLKQTGALCQIKHTVRTGNYRLPFYQAHKSHFDHLAEEIVFSRFEEKKPTILYAPSWSDSENPTSFFSLTETLISQLSSRFNLLIKLHPLLLEDHPAHLFSIMGKYEEHASVQFLVDFPAIYPLLNRCDYYLGDYSSIGYDFLAFDKPLFYFNTSNNTSPLAKCGENVTPEKLIISTEDSFKEQRKKLYNYAFGEEISPEEIKKNLRKITSPLKNDEAKNLSE